MFLVPVRAGAGAGYLELAPRVWLQTIQKEIFHPYKKFTKLHKRILKVLFITLLRNRETSVLLNFFLQLVKTTLNRKLQ